MVKTIMLCILKIVPIGSYINKFSTIGLDYAFHTFILTLYLYERNPNMQFKIGILTAWQYIFILKRGSQTN